MFRDEWIKDLTQQRIYSDLWHDYALRGVSEVLDETDKENVISNEAERRHYFDVGADAIGIIMRALIDSRLAPPQTILDFPSGSGRVTRHLRAMFPHATLAACDLYESHLDFCAAHSGAVPLMSKENLDQLDVGLWDLIFCGSLLTHLPERLFWPTIRFITRFLSPAGIAVVTLEGRHAIHIQYNRYKFLDDELFEVARKGFERIGFGFVDYNRGFLRSKFAANASYGIALVSASWLMAGLQKMDNIRVLNFTERCWDNHQDVVVIGRPGINS